VPRGFVAGDTNQCRGATMSELNISRHEEGDWHILRLEGFVDAQTLADLEEELTWLVEQGKYRIKVDLEKLTYINSTSLGLLMATYRQVRQHGGRLVLDNVSDKITNILNFLGFYRLLRDNNEDDGLAGATFRK
jgi:anti-anti-sigma factor